jgi:MoxR-like ATPase
MATDRFEGEDEMKDIFVSIDDVEQRLKQEHYLPNHEIASTMYLASRLGKPVLIEGPAGTGKTELAKCMASTTGSELIRLQCYEGLDESKALYEWNYRKQLLRIQAQSSSDAERAWRDIEEDIFSEDFLLERPLLKSIRAQHPVVLLIDEVDRLEVEAEALLLEILSEYQVSIPELGTVKANSRPLVFLTSNGTRELSEALKRRCLFLYLDYPDIEREQAILRSRVPTLSEDLARQIATFAATLRSMDLKKRPSISETIDWSLALLELAVQDLDRDTTLSTLQVLLKYRSDIEAVRSDLTRHNGDRAR